MLSLRLTLYMACGNAKYTVEEITLRVKGEVKANNTSLETHGVSLTFKAIGTNENPKGDTMDGEE